MAEDWSTSDGNAICTSGFVDEVISAHDGANGPESKTTRMFRRVFSDDGTSRTSRTPLFDRIRQVAPPWAN